jgi:ribosomal protein L35
MSGKTNKSYAKRLKVTKSGKILTRKSGHNHFNSKETHGHKGAKNRPSEFHMSNKEKSQFLVNIK